MADLVRSIEAGIDPTRQLNAQIEKQVAELVKGDPALKQYAGDLRELLVASEVILPFDAALGTCTLEWTCSRLVVLPLLAGP